MEKLIIDRSRWRTGDHGEHATGKGLTKLLSSDGWMCCLGFECLRRGLTEDDIAGCGDPQNLEFEAREKIGDMLEYSWEDGANDSSWVNSAMAINDDPYTTREMKEQQLKPLFAEQEIEIEFIN